LVIRTAAAFSNFFKPIHMELLISAATRQALYIIAGVVLLFGIVAMFIAVARGGCRNMDEDEMEAPGRDSERFTPTELGQ
jgi:hypothetical protein